MKRAALRPPGAVIAGLVLAVVLDTFIQIAWKAGVAAVPAGAFLTGAGVRALLSNGWFIAAMLAFGAQLWNWLRVLARADLSFAQPFTALSYITVLGVSSRWLHEHVSPTRMLGVALILAGVYCISRTPFRTAPGGAREPAARGPGQP